MEVNIDNLSPQRFIVYNGCRDNFFGSKCMHQYAPICIEYRMFALCNDALIMVCFGFSPRTQHCTSSVWMPIHLLCLNVTVFEPKHYAVLKCTLKLEIVLRGRYIKVSIQNNPIAIFYICLGISFFPLLNIEA